MGKRDEYRSGKGGASYKSWEGWNQRGYWGGRGEPKELVVRVESDQPGAKKRTKERQEEKSKVVQLFVLFLYVVFLPEAQG